MQRTVPACGSCKTGSCQRFEAVRVKVFSSVGPRPGVMLFPISKVICVAHASPQQSDVPGCKHIAAANTRMRTCLSTTAQAIIMQNCATFSMFLPLHSTPAYVPPTEALWPVYCIHPLRHAALRYQKLLDWVSVLSQGNTKEIGGIAASRVMTW